MRWLWFLAGCVGILLCTGVVNDSMHATSRRRHSFFGRECVGHPEKRFTISNYGLRGPIEWRALPTYVQAEYTLHGKILVQDFYLVEYPTGQIPSWSFVQIEEMIKQAIRRDPALCPYGPVCSRDMYAAFDAFPVKGKRALVIGTQKPWAEAGLVAFGAQVTTVDFNRPTLDHPSMQALNVTEMDKFCGRYDIIFSFSSLEHDGLGRYTDPLNPDGDILRMRKIYDLLRNTGFLFLSVPIGNDTLYWNAHRVYGSIRFPLLMQGWDLLNVFTPTGAFNGHLSSWILTEESHSGYDYQPITIWQKSHKGISGA